MNWYEDNKYIEEVLRYDKLCKKHIQTNKKILGPLFIGTFSGIRRFTYGTACIGYQLKIKMRNYTFSQRDKNCIY